MGEINNFLKDLLDFPMIMCYILFKSFITPMLWGMITVMLIVFMYVVITG